MAAAAYQLGNTSQAMLSSISTWIDDCSSAVLVLLQPLARFDKPSYIGCWLCVDAELAIV